MAVGHELSVTLGQPMRMKGKQGKHLYPQQSRGHD